MLSQPQQLPFNMPCQWDNQRSCSTDAIDVFTWNYYTLPPSPPASVNSNPEDSPQCGRNPHFTPEPQSENELNPCLSTSEVFELDCMDAPSTPSSVSPPPLIHQSTLSKKTLSTIGGVKKVRGNGERITTKDFVPPDVTGLSKREARLLKNRAAAFLSRQRKREEFEAMEIRVKELEEENSRLEVLASKGEKYDDLVSNMDQLRLRLAAAEKRERELTVELANQAATNLPVKSESHDLNLPPSPLYGSYQSSAISVMKQSLLSSLPSLLSLPSQTSLPISFSVPLTGPSSAGSSSTPFSHQATSCDTKDRGRTRYSHGSVGFHPCSTNSSKKMGFGGEGSETCQIIDLDGLHRLDSVSVSFEASSSQDGRGYVHVNVSDRPTKSTMQESRHTSSSLTCWPGADPSFGMTGYASPPLSTQVSPGGIDHLGVFVGTGNAHSRMDFETGTQSMPSGYTPFPQHAREQSFDYYSGIIPE